VENLLDIDFDGAAPASLQKEPTAGASGLEGLAGTPQRVASPTAGMSQPANNMDDLMGLFGNGGGNPAAAAGGTDDLMNGFSGLNMGDQAAPTPAQTGQKKTNEDLLSLF
jgi:AP-1 complex subunit beta-1